MAVYLANTVVDKVYLNQQICVDKHCDTASSMDVVTVVTGIHHYLVPVEMELES